MQTFARTLGRTLSTTRSTLLESMMAFLPTHYGPALSLVVLLWNYQVPWIIMMMTVAF